MATTKTLTPTNQAITLAAFTEKPDNRTNVTNDDKLADAVNALNSNSMMKHGIVNSIASDTAILNYDPGTYQIALSASSTYVPDRYGTLTVLDSGDVYKSFIFVKTATNTMYYRVGHKTNGTWYGDWNEVAKASKFAPQTGDLTTISTLTPIRADVAKYSVSGNVCTIFINNVQFDRSISSDTAILTCPIKPKYHTRFIMLDQSNNIMNSYVSANTGDIITTGYTSGKYMYGSVSFIIN